MAFFVTLLSDILLIRLSTISANFFVTHKSSPTSLDEQLTDS